MKTGTRALVLAAYLCLGAGPLCAAPEASSVAGDGPWPLAMLALLLLSLPVAALLVAVFAVRSRTRELAAKTRAFEAEVAERERAERAARQSEQRLELALDGAELGLWDRDLKTGKAVFNRRWAEMLGYSLDDIAPNVQSWVDLIHPDDRERAVQALKDHIEGRTSAYECEHRLRMRSGDFRWILSRGKVVSRDAGGTPLRVAGTHLDITERKRTEQAVRESEERYRVLFEQAADSIVLLDPGNGAFDEFNDVAHRSLGFTREEFTAMRLQDIEPHAGGDPIRRHVDETTRTGSGSFEARHLTRSGDLREILVRTRPVSIHGRVYLHEVWRDVTEFRKADAARRALEMKMQHTQKLESLGVLAGGIAHDFNNLLTGVLGNADLALSELPAGSPIRGHLHAIETAGRRAAELCHQMLAYSGRATFVVDVVKLNELVSELAHLLEVSISKKARIEYEFDPALPPVRADATQVRQIVMNLITNASEALGDEGGAIRIVTGTVHGATERLEEHFLESPDPERTYVALAVSDTGCGMEEDTRDRIFDPFFSTKFTGRGLGLAAVLGIVRGHKGAISVSSRTGVGTTIRVLLPVQESEKVSADETPLELPVQWVGGGTILLVEDEQTVREVTAKMLGTMGFDVLCADDGVRAVALYRENADRIDCVLLDLTMPNMDGEQTLAELRKVRDEVLVILASGYDEEDLRERFRHRPPADFLQKPYRREVLSKTLRGVLTA